jgi:hypothetical protein
VKLPDPTQKNVIILSGEFAGEEGFCLGKTGTEEGVFAVVPNSSNDILALHFPNEFGILINKGQISGRN